MERLEARDVRYEYRTKLQLVHAVNGVSCVFEPGKVYAVVGASGSGKTTFLSLLAGLDVPAGGAITLDGKSTAELDRDAYRLEHVSVIYQNYNLFYHLTVLENAAYPLYVKKIAKKDADAVARRTLLRVGLTEEQFTRLPNMLSGGEQQRVAIARALATHPKILLCDEATSALDPQTTQSILALIRDIHDKLGITVIVITHQMSVVEQICTRVAILDNGGVAEEGEVNKVFASPQSKAAKRLVYPDGYEQSVAHFDEGGVLRVVFNGAKATMAPMIAQMAIDCGIAASILTASTKSIGDKAYGNMILGIPGGADALARAMQYLKAIPDILVEEVGNRE